VVVVVDPLGGQNPGFLLGEDAKRGVDIDVGLVADQPDRPEHVRPLLGAVFLRDALLGEDDTEPLGAVAFGALRGREYLLGVQQAVGVDARIEVDRLGTEPTVLGTVAGLGVDDATRVDGPVAEVCPHGVGRRGEVRDGLGEQRQPVGPVETLPVEHPRDRLVYRSVARLVNHISTSR